jgi:PKD repeat protein
MIHNDKQFEDLIRQTLENFEVDYNPAHWNELEGRLNIIGQGVFVSMNTFYSAFVVAGVFLAGLVYFGMPDNSGQHGKNNLSGVVDEKILDDTTGLAINQSKNFGSSNSARINHIGNTEQSGIDISKNTNDTGSVLDKTEDSNADSKLNNPLENTDAKDKVLISKSKRKSGVSQGCEGTPVTFMSGLEKESGNYLWNFGDGFFSNDVNPEHTFSSTGVFDVSLLVTPLTGGNITPMTIEDQIKINPRPKASFNYSYQMNYLNVPQVRFENHSSQAVKVIWKVGDEVISTENNPIYNFSKKGTYQVDLIAINEFGCEDITSKNVIIKEDYNLMAPLEFTPDGDGKNDTFMPGAIKLIDGTFTLKIMDSKTNMVIFETNDVNKPWNGTIAGTSVKASRDVYPWEVSIVYRNGSKDEFKGEVKLKR